MMFGLSEISESGRERVNEAGVNVQGENAHHTYKPSPRQLECYFKSLSTFSLKRIPPFHLDSDPSAQQSPGITPLAQPADIQTRQCSKATV
jgi:hypothetical protein